MIRASLGTAKALQLEHCHVDVLPTTAYLLTPGRCSNYCAFCTQSANSNSKEEFLSRVSWPKYPFSLIVDSLGKAYQDGLLKQVCIQMVKNGQPKESTNFIVKAIQNSSYIPITLSCVVDSLAEADYYFSLGIKHLGISLDAVTPQIYQKIKTGQWQKTVSLIEEIARKYPNRLTTHIIIGLGETEEEAVQLITYLTKINVNVGLFAFTPIKGTALQYLPPPSLGSYRRIQIAYYLIKQGINDFLYDRKGKLISFGLERSLLADFLDQGIPFQTSGCPDCNRPYYNESPGKKLYNYPRPLTVIEFANALEECND